MNGRANNEPLLRVRDLSVAYRKDDRWQPVVEHVDLDLFDGETLGLVGESGCGKSTTALAILRLLAPANRTKVSGEIRFGGRDLLQVSEQEMRKVRGSEIAMIPQDPFTSLNPLFTIGSQVREALRVHQHIDAAGIDDAVVASLRKVRFGRPEQRMRQYPHELSGGMRQRAVGAIATSCNPRLLLADEPTTALDVTVQARYLDMLKSLQRETGLAMLFITHDLGVVARVCDRVAVMRAGRIVESGTVEQVLRDPAHEYTRTLLQSTPSIRKRSGLQPVTTNAEPVLAARNLSKHFDPRRRSGWKSSPWQVKAVDDVSLQIHEGESVGLVGESGCGKTTLSRLLLQLASPSGGTVQFRGNDLAGLEGDGLSKFRREVQPVFQDPYGSLNPRMRIGRIISEPLRAGRKLSAPDIETKVSEVLQQVELKPADAGSFPAEFSGGQRQRIAIARALVSDPALIVLDEAVSSQDVSIRAQILRLLRSIQQRRTLAFLFISHDLATVRFLCDRVYVMYLGSIVEQGPADALYESPAHPYTRTLMDAVLPLVPGAGRMVQADAAEVPGSAETEPQGCRFHPRCPFAIERCRKEKPALRQFGDPGQRAACHRLEELPARDEGETDDRQAR